MSIKQMEGATPVLIAAQEGHTACIEALAERGADLNQPVKDGATPVFIAAENGHTACIEALAERGADLNQPMKDGATPVFIAAENGHTDCIEALAERGANVNQTDKDGYTPVFVAAENGHTACIEALAERGADVDQAKENGATPVLIAAQEGHTACIEALAERGADVNQADEDGTTPVLIAAYNGHTACIERLAEYGAHLTEPAWRGKTPIVIAQEQGHTDVVELLERLIAHPPKPKKIDNAPKNDNTDHDSTVNNTTGAATSTERALTRQLKDLQVLVCETHLFSDPQPTTVAAHTENQTHVQAVEERLKQTITANADLQTQIDALVHGDAYGQGLAALQKTCMQQIEEHQAQLNEQNAQHLCEQEKLAQSHHNLQHGVDSLQTQHDELYQAHLAKLAIAREQQALQQPEAVRHFYNTLEAQLAAKLMAAMSLASGLLQRASTKTDQNVEVAAEITRGLCEAVPIIGGPVGAVLGLAIEKVGTKKKEKQQSKKSQAVLASLLSPTNAFEFAELIARRIAQHYREQLNLLSPKEAVIEAEKVVRLVYNFLKDKQLEGHQSDTLETKVSVLVNYVLKQFTINATSSPKAQAPTQQAASTSPAMTKAMLAQQGKSQQLEERVELQGTYQRNKMENLARENAELRGELDEVKTELSTLREMQAEHNELKAQVALLMQAHQPPVAPHRTAPHAALIRPPSTTGQAANQTKPTSQSFGYRP